MSDRADDVKCSLLYTDQTGALIINREEIFQATSKSSGGGITRISGYSEYRLSAYELTTGKLISRVELGEGQKEGECLILGLLNNQLWMFSMNSELGFHSRNPRTLEVTKTQAEFQAAAPFTGFKFGIPEWPQIPRFYGMDNAYTNIILTDNAGFRYKFDPVKQTLTKTTEEVVSCDSWSSSNKPLNTTIQLDSDNSINLNGSPRKTIQFNYKATSFENSYLNAEFITTTDLEQLAKLYREEIGALQQHKDSLTNALQELQRTYPILVKEKGWPSGMNTNERNAYYKVTQLQRDTADCNYKQRSIQQQGIRSSKSQSVIDATSLLLFHCNDITDTSRCIITSISIQPNKTIKENWSTSLNRYYFNPDKASASGAFETVMSDGNPEFQYKWAITHENKLVFISQLQMCCLDLKTGKLIWDIDL